MGEVWLHEAIATSYLPVLDVLARLAEKGHRNLATVGITPVLAAQLDDPECLQATRSWAADWLWRTQELGQYDRPAAAREAQQANATLHALQTTHRAGLSTAWRRLADAGVVELLGGPAAHPFQPLLDDRTAAFSLLTGMDDHLAKPVARDRLIAMVQHWLAPADA